MTAVISITFTPTRTNKLRWAIYLRMINKPELIREAIDGPAECWWKDDCDDLAELEWRATEQLWPPHQSDAPELSPHRIATLRAALTALDGIRQARRLGDD
jgi:hypothetical protein